MRDEERRTIGEEPSNPYIPVVPGSGPSVPHYYGDKVRSIFIMSAGVMLVLSPFLDYGTPGVLPFEIGGALVFAILGALTNPKNKMSMITNTFAAGVGVLTYEILALSSYFDSRYLAFIEREALAIAFLAALYFSVKTVRNMLMGKIGQRDNASEFFEQEKREYKDMIGDGDLGDN